MTIHTDTLLNTDTVSSHAAASFTVATNGISGEVGAFAVRSAGQETATPAGLDLPFPFRASSAARGMQVDFLTPRDTTPCASRALAIAQSLRDLWFRPPDTLRVGATWGDSASYLLCRDSIPLRATVYRIFRITGATEQGGRAVLSISRVSRTTIEGTGVQFGEPVDVSGSGSTDLVYVFDPTAGEVMSAGGHATLDLSFRSRLRTQAVRQLVEIRIGRS